MLGVERKAVNQTVGVVLIKSEKQSQKVSVLSDDEQVQPTPNISFTTHQLIEKITLIGAPR